MPPQSGIVLFTSYQLFVENIVLATVLGVLLGAKLGRHRGPLLAFTLIAAKEIAEVYLPPGTGAVSDAGAGLLGALVAWTVIGLYAGRQRESGKGGHAHAHAH